MDDAAEKHVAAAAAAQLVEDGMVVGLGTGRTVGHLLPLLAQRGARAQYVASSIRTADAARELGLDVQPFAGPESVGRLDLAIDSADQVDSKGWLIKGGGAAHTRERVVAAAADRFVVIVDSRKVVTTLTPPVPIELRDFGLAAALRTLRPCTLRPVPRSPDGGWIADYTGSVGNPARLALWLDSFPGVVAHGLFPPSLVHEIIIGRGTDVLRVHPEG